MNRREALLFAAQALLCAGIAEAQVEAKHALAAIEGVSISDLILYGEALLTEEKEGQLRAVVYRRAAGEPLAYILQERYFMGLRFIVNKHVLIPRQETELLCECAIEIIQQQKIKTVLDMCTGSGCIGISIAHYAHAAVTLADVDEKALAIAEQNAVLHKVPAVCLKTDLFLNVKDVYGMIVCNPPYITAKDYGQLNADVREHEPKKALYGGEDGLVFYEKIAAQAGEHLNKDGYLLLEIGYDQGESAPALFKKAGFVIEAVKKDYAQIDRIVIARKI